MTSSWFFLSTLNYDARSTTIRCTTNYLSSTFLINVFLYLNGIVPFIPVLSSMATQVPVFLFIPLKKDITFLSKCSLMLNGLEADSRGTEPKWTEPKLRVSSLWLTSSGGWEPALYKIYGNIFCIMQGNALSAMKFREE